jgi:hypothetical protein
MPYTEDGDIGSSGRYTEYSTFYTAKACLEGTKDELIEQAKELIPIGKAFDLKGPRKGKNEKEASIECMAVYDSTGEVRSQINKPDPYIGWYENPDFPPWKAPVSTGR